MPTYTYRCRDCDNVFEEMQRITAEPAATCARCGSEQCVRQITGGTFHLKGSGWYATDYNGKSGAPAPACSAGPEAAAACGNQGCPAKAAAA